MALWGAVLGHTNLLYHAAGWLEGGLTASYEKLVLDIEMLQHMVEFLKQIPSKRSGELAFDAIAGVPTGGHFFGSPHTMGRYNRLLPAARLQLAELRELADRRRQGRDRAGDRHLEAGARRI